MITSAPRSASTFPPQLYPPSVRSSALYGPRAIESLSKAMSIFRGKLIANRRLVYTLRNIPQTGDPRLCRNNPPSLSPSPKTGPEPLPSLPHPDDLEYGAASAIARWTSQGKEVGYLMVTKGEAGIDSMHPDETARLRMKEEINSARVVGVNSVEFLDYKDGVIEYGLPLRKDISRAIRKFKPDVLISGNFEMFFPWRQLQLRRPPGRWRRSPGRRPRRRQPMDISRNHGRGRRALARPQDTSSSPPLPSPPTTST